MTNRWQRPPAWFLIPSLFLEASSGCEDSGGRRPLAEDVEAAVGAKVKLQLNSGCVPRKHATKTETWMSMATYLGLGTWLTRLAENRGLARVEIQT